MTQHPPESLTLYTTWQQTGEPCAFRDYKAPSGFHFPTATSSPSDAPYVERETWGEVLAAREAEATQDGASGPVCPTSEEPL